MTIVILSLKDSGALQDDYIEQLARWHHNEWLHLNPGATFGKRLARYNKIVITKALPEIFIACENEKLLGSVTLDKEDMDTRQYLTPWLASLFVEPNSRSLGVASALIKYCLDDAKQKNFKNLYLFTEDQTIFYQHRGWHFVETLGYRNVDVDLMCQNLKK